MSQYSPSGRPIASRFSSLKEYDQALKKFKEQQSSEVETEADGKLAEAKRRSQVRRLSKGRQDPTRN